MVGRYEGKNFAAEIGRSQFTLEVGEKINEASPKSFRVLLSRSSRHLMFTDRMEGWQL